MHKGEQNRYDLNTEKKILLPLNLQKNRTENSKKLSLLLLLYLHHSSSWGIAKKSTKNFNLPLYLQSSRSFIIINSSIIEKHHKKLRATKSLVFSDSFCKPPQILKNHHCN